MKIYGLILAGGIGSRCSEDIPKQYIKIDDKPIFIYTAEEMKRSNLLNGVCIVCSKEWQGYVKEQCEKYDINLICVCDAGETGIESIWSGLSTLLGIGVVDEDIVVIQDANRPFLDSIDISMGVKLCNTGSGCSMGVTSQINDQVSIMGESKKLVSRNGLYELIRPEFHTIHNLKYSKELYDSKKFLSQNPVCILLENNEDIEIFECKSLPVKITYPSDLEVFKAVLHWRNLNRLEIVK